MEDDESFRMVRVRTPELEVFGSLRGPGRRDVATPPVDPSLLIRARDHDTNRDGPDCGSQVPPAGASQRIKHLELGLRTRAIRKLSPSSIDWYQELHPLATHFFGLSNSR